MRHEPIEFGVVNTHSRAGRDRRTRRLARPANLYASDETKQPAAAVIDEAFAGFAQPHGQRIEPGLVAALASQLEALDRQREQLSHLLRSIDADRV